MMFGIAFHVNGTEWPCRAEVLAGTAPDATFFVYNRNLGRFGVGRVGCDHEDGTSGAVAGTVAAFHAVGQGDAILFDPYGMTNLVADLSATVIGRMAPAGQTSAHLVHSGRQ